MKSGKGRTRMLSCEIWYYRCLLDWTKKHERGDSSEKRNKSLENWKVEKCIQIDRLKVRYRNRTEGEPIMIRHCSPCNQIKP